MTDSPSYYQLETGDLYDLFVEQRGLEVVRQHLEMAALEYLWRCRHKGQYLRDLEKVRVIVERLIDMADHEGDGVPGGPTLDDALSVLAQHGWLGIPPTVLAARMEPPPVPAATLDDALHVLAQHGWRGVPPPLPPRDGSGIAAVDHVGIYETLTGEAAP